MANKVFISHATEDRAIAELLKETILTVSNHTIQPWFSSDIDEGGGFGVGSLWFNTIMERLGESDACICLITRTSVHSPWIPFEAGVSAGKNMSNYVIPLCLLPDFDQIPAPLQSWQAYRYTSKEQAHEFYGKLLRAYGQVYSASAHEPRVEETVAKINLLAKRIHPRTRTKIYTAKVASRRPPFTNKRGNLTHLLRLDGLISPEGVDYAPPLEHLPDENHWLYYIDAPEYPEVKQGDTICFTINKVDERTSAYHHTDNSRNIYPERLWVFGKL